MVVWKENLISFWEEWLIDKATYKIGFIYLTLKYWLANIEFKIKLA